MKGLRKGGGFTDEYTKVCQDDAEVLKILWNAGAVFYARTTEPQALVYCFITACLRGFVWLKDIDDDRDFKLRNRYHH